MLKLNVWTPALTGKRPVMVYFHGGGFSFGSSYELPSHEGAQMARHHDVVQVSVNHRLNVLGFFDLSEIGGPAYADSVNVGMTDLVASLRWVRDNIANFGGDPDTRHDLRPVGRRLQGDPSDGHALGGGTVPSRLGAVGRRRQSSQRRAIQRAGQADDEGAGTAAQRHRLAAEDGVGQAERGRQRRRRQDQSARAAGATGPGAPPGAHAARRLGTHRRWPHHHVRSFYDAAPEISKNVPMLIGSVSEEGNRMSSQPTEAEWHATLARAYGRGQGDAP